MCRESSRSLPANSTIMSLSPSRRSLQLDVSSLESSHCKEERRETIVSETSPSTIMERVATIAHRNYRALAYLVVVGCYVIGFTEYVYLRLTVLVSNPGGTVKMSRDSNGKDGIHYAIGVAVFFAIGLFQIICFFGLTLSESLLSAARSRREGNEVSLKVSILITRTIQKTFVCYATCSLIICIIIFYMLRIEDSLDRTASTICVYLFDAFILLYFLCFPLITIIYHPHIQCRTEITPQIFSSPNFSNFSPPLVHSNQSTLHNAHNEYSIPTLDAPPPPGSLPSQTHPIPPPRLRRPTTSYRTITTV